jgi:hypothetical protein
VSGEFEEGDVTPEDCVCEEFCFLDLGGMKIFLLILGLSLRA